MLDFLFWINLPKNLNKFFDLTELNFGKIEEKLNVKIFFYNN